jgi:hypothetical protein
MWRYWFYFWLFDFRTTWFSWFRMRHKWIFTSQVGLKIFIFRNNSKLQIWVTETEVTYFNKWWFVIIYSVVNIYSVVSQSKFANAVEICCCSCSVDTVPWKLSVIQMPTNSTWTSFSRAFLLFHVPTQWPSLLLYSPSESFFFSSYWPQISSKNHKWDSMINCNFVEIFWKCIRIKLGLLTGTFCWNWLMKWRQRNDSRPSGFHTVGSSSHQVLRIIEA